MFVKKLSLVVLLLCGLAGFLLFFPSCSKINEATQLGSGLIPPVDNVSTFEISLKTETNNILLNDTTKLGFNDPVALGNISNDPEFGQTKANVYFTLGLRQYGTYPFLSRDSVSMDSVVLSMAFTGSYGDTNSLQTVRVFEIAANSGFNDTTVYQFNHPGFTTTGAELGSKSFMTSELKNPVRLIRKDTQTVSNVLRIRLDTALGRRFAGFDTTATGGFGSDSLFKTMFRGLAVQAGTGGNSLAYFTLADQSKTKLTVYFRARRNGVTDTASVDFVHNQRQRFTGVPVAGGQANSIIRMPGGGWASYLTNGTAEDDKVYLQSTPGSLATIRIPALDTMSNAIVHLAELIAYRIPTPLDHLLTPPAQLMLDRVNQAGDTAFTLENDFPVSLNSAVSYSTFGGQLRSDNTYRFNISRHVQGIITRKERNAVLRLYAPYETTLFIKNLGTFLTIPVVQRVAEGRVVLGGGNYADPGLRLRLRIVYSKI